MHKGWSHALMRIMLFLVFLVVLASFVLSLGKTTGPRHEPSAFSERLDYNTATFDQYRDWSERRLRASRLDNPGNEIINRLLPFRLEPDADCPVSADGKYANGIVLTHGLLASPYSMKDIGDYFQSHCFLVLGVLMNDHGTRPGDMLKGHWEDWIAEVHMATRLVSQQVDKVYLSGHSAGGALSVLEASRNPDVDALVLFAPAMGILDVSKYAGMLSQLGDIFSGASWYKVENDEAIYRYESFAFRAVQETWDLIQATQQEVAAHPLSIPVMTVASVQDSTIDVQATFDFMAQQTNPLSFTLLYSQHDLPPYYRTRVYNSNAPEQGVISVSHLGLMTPPDHPWYGRDGGYRSCGHYFGNDADSFARCKAGERDFYGEPTQENRQFGLIERIAFNPFWDDLLDDIDLFIEQVSMDRRGMPIEPELEDPLEL
jgi:esterase/lipase